MKQISVIVPVYNNERTLTTLCEQIIDTLDDELREIILVNDCSKDNSLSVIRKLAIRDNIFGLNLSNNVGQNQALMLGLAEAKGNFVVFMDADLQDSPAMLPVLFSKLQKSHAEVIFAGRVGNYSTFTRWITSRGFKYLLHILSGFRLPSDAGLYCMMTKTMKQALLAIYEDGGYIQSYMARTGLRMIAYPSERSDSQTTNYTSAMRRSVAWNAIRDILGWHRIHAQPSSQIEYIK